MRAIDGMWPFDLLWQNPGYLIAFVAGYTIALWMAHTAIVVPYTSRPSLEAVSGGAFALMAYHATRHLGVRA